MNRFRMMKSICGRSFCSFGRGSKEICCIQRGGRCSLKEDLLGKLDYMTGLVDFIEERSPVILKEYRQKLEDKVKELLNGTAIDEGRIAAEVVIYADKICVDEETVRLRSHIENTRQELLSGEV